MRAEHRHARVAIEPLEVAHLALAEDEHARRAADIRESRRGRGRSSGCAGWRWVARARRFRSAVRAADRSRRTGSAEAAPPSTTVSSVLLDAHGRETDHRSGSIKSEIAVGAPEQHVTVSLAELRNTITASLPSPISAAASLDGHRLHRVAAGANDAAAAVRRAPAAPRGSAPASATAGVRRRRSASCSTCP